MKVAVTGGAGFIGANLCRALLAETGVQVSVIDDLSTGDSRNLEGLDVSFVDGSILDPKALDEALSGADSVVHLAARPSVARSIDNPLQTHESNASGTLAVLEAARRLRIPHIVVASSSSVYGGNPVSPKSEDLATRPLSPYAASKLVTEAYALAYQASFGLRAIAFRFFNVYGPLQPAGHAYAACIPAFITAALKGEPVMINGDGKQSRDFTFVEDVARVITEAVKTKTASERPVNLAFGGSADLLTLLKEIEAIVGSEIKVTHGPERPGDVRHSQADPTDLLSLFPALEPVPLTAGLGKTVQWWRDLHC
jgi:UDP-glucose 4-epimerase